ncbi:hypothetical protein EZS27_006228 [termite gut metagenome]|uniref:Phosphatidylglycerol lysyltransferase C-terminal domain-containing protein n=1 Tax=termite gut metagenome TaxID=433724 RepID=A0A5J4SJR5_9ZZZZ
MIITFKDLTIYDKDIIISYTMNCKYRNCDLSFSNLCSWRFLYNTKFTIIDEFLVFKFWVGSKQVYMQPIGEGDLTKLLDILIADAKADGKPFYILGLCLEMKVKLESILPDKFTFTTKRSYSDYIYLRENLVTLKGKKYQSKRNHINRFKKEYGGYKYIPIALDTIQDCLSVEAEWQKSNDRKQGGKADDENQAVLYALTHFEELGLMGGILYVNDRAVAFTYGMPINQDTFGVHVEKADISINGVGSMINYEFAQRIPEQYIYINREEDLGIEGLRKAKLSYYPEIILDKYVAHLTEEPLL